MGHLTCLNPFGNEEKLYLLPGQLSAAIRFEWIKDFLGGKREVSDEELGKFIRTLLPENPEKLKSEVRIFGLIDPANDEERQLLQRIQRLCASM